MINSSKVHFSSKPKRAFPFEESDQINPPKKQKAGSLNHTTYPKDMACNKDVPLAEKMRPVNLIDYIGQEQVIGPDTVLQQLLMKGHVPSVILWGPPGCGKSSLANIIASLSKEKYKENVNIKKLSATSSGVNNVRDAVSTAKDGSKLNKKTILFMDEIHRFNKLQQDIFLPHVEAGTLTLIGTTTENPSYSLNSALLSRCRVFALNKLTASNVVEILSKAVQSLNGKIQESPDVKFKMDSQNKFSAGPKVDFIINQSVIEWLAEVCDGDARVALNGLELAVKTTVLNKLNYSSYKTVTIDLHDIKESLQQAHMLSDRETKHSHHMYSALHKSIRAGNANAALYWLARIMAVKEDPVDIARRLVRISSEDIGLSDPDALGIAVHTMHGCQMIGMPECDLLLGQCVVYLARAPKSRLMYNALNSAKELIMNHNGPQPVVPLHIRDRSGQRKLQANLGRFKDNLLRKEESGKNYLPLGLEHEHFFLQD